MNHTAITGSKAVERIGYDREKKTLEVKFKNGNTYRYHDVPAEVHEQLLSCDSVGAHFAQHVRGKFDHKRA